MIYTQNLPSKPGCYLFKDSSNKILYVGKAKDLKKRVKSYYNRTVDKKTELLIKKAENIDFIVTDTEVESLILENTLIKKHKPKYNINLKDSKKYAYIKLTNEQFPKLVVARKRTDDSKYFGPFVSAVNRDYVLEVLKRTFKIRTCKRLPKKACLRYHIGLCDAPCVGNITEHDYNEQIDSAISVLKGHTKELITYLKKQMQINSTNKNYEKAKTYRDQIVSIESLQEKQIMDRNKKYDEDIINYIIKDSRIYLIVFSIHRGILENKNEFEFDHNPDFFEEFIIQYYSINPIPKELVLPQTISSPLIDYLSEKKKSKVHLTVPKKGEKKKLLELVQKNIEISFFGNLLALAELQKVLGLQETPKVIECFDISHTAGTHIVGSMVQFRNGKPDKTNYRRFKIKTITESDDAGCIAEVVIRRYSRLINEKQPLPDLVVIDGGKPQLNASLRVMTEIGVRIPIIALAKKLEEIYFPGNPHPLKLARNNKALQLLQRLRDEAHRFAITYHKLLRKKQIRNENGI